MRRLQLLHALQLFQPALGLFGLGCLVAKAAYKFVDMRNAPLLFFEAGLLICHALCTHAFEIRVVAFIGVKLLLLDMQYAFAAGVNKIPVMRDHQQGTGVLLQPLL